MAVPAENRPFERFALDIEGRLTRERRFEGFAVNLYVASVQTSLDWQSEVVQRSGFDRSSRALGMTVFPGVVRTGARAPLKKTSFTIARVVLP